MFYPVRSFIVALVIYLAIIMAIGFNHQNQTAQPLISLEIDAVAIGDINQHQHNSKIAKITPKNPPINDSNNAKIKHQHFDNQQHDEANKKMINSDKNLDAKKVQAIFQPLPEIPEDLRYEAFSTKIIAQFFINKKGEVSTVKLIQPSKNPRLNLLLIKSLQRWKFSESSEDNSQIINVKFKVEE